MGSAIFSLSVNFENHIKMNDVAMKAIPREEEGIFRKNRSNRYSAIRNMNPKMAFATANPVVPNKAKNSASQTM